MIKKFIHWLKNCTLFGGIPNVDQINTQFARILEQYDSILEECDTQVNELHADIDRMENKLLILEVEENKAKFYKNTLNSFLGYKV